MNIIDKNLLLFKIMVPKPSPYQLISIGNGYDGTYLIPDDLKGIKACYSPGVNNNKFFEDFLAINFNIKSHLCDFSSDVDKFSTPLIEGMQTFEKKWLDITESSNNISLSEWINKYSLDSSEELMLQMDIEGAEFKNLNNIDDLVLKRFRIIVIEIHGLSILFDHKDNHLKILLEKLNKFFLCVHAHPNNCCGEVLNTEYNINLPNIIELTFLRRDRFDNNCETTLYPVLPHPLDITNTNNRPIFLNSNWLFDNNCKINQDKINKELNNYDLNYLKNKVKMFKNIFKNSASSLQAHPSTNNLPVNYNLNLANGKEYILNNNKSGLISKKEPFFFHSASGSNQWITVDLGEIYSISELRVHNRSDMCFDRAELLAYVIHSESIFDPTNITPMYCDEYFLRGKMPSITKIPHVSGRYLTIISLKFDPIHFSFIEIFGE